MPLAVFTNCSALVEAKLALYVPVSFHLVHKIKSILFKYEWFGYYALIIHVVKPINH